MKKIIIILTSSALLFAACNSKAQGPVKLIFETDMGNDVDDAVALDMIHKYIDDGMVDLLAVCLNKQDPGTAEYIDLFNTWYGHPDIPIGIIHDGPMCSHPDNEFTRIVWEMKDDQGQPLFKGSLDDYQSLPDAVTLYRKILASQRDHSVVIASVGFSTNLARLLKTGPDEYSKLSGSELVKKKVKLLSVMGGHIIQKKTPEYNIVKDIPSAKEVFENWPTKLVASPYELGVQVQYPATSIENDFSWTEHHPLVESYKSYLPMPYDRWMWDPTALIYAVEGSERFGISEPGIFSVNEKGMTTFTHSADGNCYYLTVDEAQAKALVDYLVEITTRKPACKQ